MTKYLARATFMRCVGQPLSALSSERWRAARTGCGCTRSRPAGAGGEASLARAGGVAMRKAARERERLKRKNLRRGKFSGRLWAKKKSRGALSFAQIDTLARYRSQNGAPYGFSCHHRARRGRVRRNQWRETASAAARGRIADFLLRRVSDLRF
jgi:hypothetical protein